MPFTDDAGVVAADADCATHKAKNFRLADTESTAMLRAIIPGVDWQGTGPTLRARRADLYRVALTHANWALDTHDLAIGTFVLSSAKATTLIQKPLARMEKAALEWPTFLLQFERSAAAAYTAGDTLISRADVISLRVPTQAANQVSTAWMAKFTVGLILGTPNARRAMAWLEYYTQSYDEYSSTSSSIKLLGWIDAQSVADGLHAETSAQHELRAYNNSMTLSGAITDPALEKYVAVGVAREVQAQVELREARHASDGSKTYTRNRVLLFLQADAKVLYNMLQHHDSYPQLLSLLEALAAARPALNLTPNAGLYTPHGLRQLNQSYSDMSRVVEVAQAAGKTAAQDLATYIARCARDGTGAPGNASIGAPGGAGESETARGAGAAGAAARLEAAKLDGDNPAILADVVTLLKKESHDPLDVMELLLRGRSTAHPDRKPTKLTHLLAYGLVQASLIDAELAPIDIYSKLYLGDYFARHIAAKVVQKGLATTAIMKGLKLDDWAEAMRGDEWRQQADAVNKLLVPVFEKIHIAKPTAENQVQRVAIQQVYKDLVALDKLTWLIGAAFEAAGLQSSGPESARDIIEDALQWCKFHMGVTHEANSVISAGVAELVWGTLHEGCLWYKASRNKLNPVGQLHKTFLSADTDTGARGEWKQLRESLAAAAERNRQDRLTGYYHGTGTLSRVGADSYAVSSGEAPTKKQKADHTRQDGGYHDAWWQHDGWWQEPKWQEDKQESFWKDATTSFEKQGDVLIVTSTAGHQARYDAKAARADLKENGTDPKSVCVVWLLTSAMHIPCPTPGDPRHAAGGEAHPNLSWFKPKKYRINEDGTPYSYGKSPKRGAGGGGGSSAGGKGAKGGKGSPKGKGGKGGKGHGKGSGWNGKGEPWGGKGKGRGGGYAHSTAQGMHNPNMTQNQPFAHPETQNADPQRRCMQHRHKGAALQLGGQMRESEAAPDTRRWPSVGLHITIAPTGEHAMHSTSQGMHNPNMTQNQPFAHIDMEQTGDITRRFVAEYPGAQLAWLPSEERRIDDLGLTTCKGSPAYDGDPLRGDPWRSAVADMAVIKRILAPPKDPYAPTILIACHHSVAFPRAMQKRFPNEVVITADYRQSTWGGLHYCGDVMDIIWKRWWFLVAGHPPCAPAAKSNKNKGADKGGLLARLRSGSHFRGMALVVILYSAPSDYAYVEQPDSDLDECWRKPNLTVWHHEHGLPYSKPWRLRSRGILQVVPSDEVRVQETAPHRTHCFDPIERDRIRSETPPSLASGFAAGLRLESRKAPPPNLWLEIEALATGYANNGWPVPADYKDLRAVTQPNAWLVATATPSAAAASNDGADREKRYSEERNSSTTGSPSLAGARALGSEGAPTHDAEGALQGARITTPPSGG